MLKILSKMGISLLSCYHGAQIFEAYGLGKDVVDRAFAGSVSRIGGLSFADLQAEVESFWAKGFPDKALSKLEDYGFIQSKPKGEHHANNQARAGGQGSTWASVHARTCPHAWCSQGHTSLPRPLLTSHRPLDTQVMAKLLHRSIGLGGKERDVDAYDAYVQHFAAAPVTVLRDCLELVSDREPIELSAVESAEVLMARFCTGGMSLGAISRETHETIAIAMNRIGGKSNSGEGGEDPVRWERVEGSVDGVATSLPHLRGLQDGDLATSKIKQVRGVDGSAGRGDEEQRGRGASTLHPSRSHVSARSACVARTLHNAALSRRLHPLVPRARTCDLPQVASGRFGVTPEFLVNADQLEIKIAQGAKPGEGGQLPGKKVSVGQNQGGVEACAT